MEPQDIINEIEDHIGSINSQQALDFLYEITEWCNDIIDVIEASEGK